MSLFNAFGMHDLEDDLFGTRQMQNMNNMMNSLFANPFGGFGNMASPFGMLGNGRHGSSLMPMMPQMPNMNALLSGNMNMGMMGMGNIGMGSSFSSSTVVMANGPGGRPQVIRSTSTTKVGPNGVKETKSTLEDSRSGTKKMAIGHHIGERAHVMEKEQNTYSGDLEEREEYINIEEEEVEEFDREFRQKAGGFINGNGGRGQLTITDVTPDTRLAITAAPSTSPPPKSPGLSPTVSPAVLHHKSRKAPRSSPLTTPHHSVREVYSHTQPARRRAIHSQARTPKEHHSHKKTSQHQ